MEPREGKKRGKLRNKMSKVLSLTLTKKQCIQKRQKQKHSTGVALSCSPDENIEQVETLSKV